MSQVPPAPTLSKGCVVFCRSHHHLVEDVQPPEDGGDTVVRLACLDDDANGQITWAIRSLALCFEHKLFLSATPHNGHSNSFSALLEILDPSRFCRGVPVRNKADLRRIGEVMPKRAEDEANAFVKSAWPGSSRPAR